MNNWLKKLKVKAILPAAAILAAAAIGTTFAWQNWDLGVTNQLKAHDTDVTIEEEFDAYDYKKVKFTNTGSSSVFLRVSYTEYWEMVKGSESYLLSNQVGATDVAIKIWTEKWPEYSSNPAIPDWTEGEDGWFYYNWILKADTSTGLILTDVDLIQPLPEAYQNADYHLYFKTEAVQCSDGSNTLNSPEVNAAATKKVFGVSPTSVDYSTGKVTWPTS